MGEINDEESGCVHTPLECRQKWLHEFSSMRKWTKAEDELVLGFPFEENSLQKKFKYWERICSTEKKINRTAFACMQRYLRKTTARADRRLGWERSEQVMLKNAVSQYGENDWEAVASVLPKKHRPTAAKRQWAYMKLNCIDKQIENEQRKRPAIMETVEYLEQTIDNANTNVDEFLVNTKATKEMKVKVKENKHWSRSDSRRLSFAVNAVDTSSESGNNANEKRYRTFKFLVGSCRTDSMENPRRV